MNLNFVLPLVLACASASSAIADDITIDPHPFVSTLTRVQVAQDLRDFRAGVNPWADDYNHIAAVGSSRTRADARAEFVAERGAVAAFNGEDSGSHYLMRVAATKAWPAKSEIATAVLGPAHAD